MTKRAVAGPGVSIERDLDCVTRDGCVLRADRYRPDTDAALPTLLLRTPYDKTYAHHSVYAHPAWYARQGFNVLVQDMRGRFSSEGQFEPFVNEGSDGYDTVEWAATLDGSNGQVGLYGQSYVGYAQLAAAVERPPHLAAIAPGVTSGDPYGWLFEGGAFRLAFAAVWAAFLGLGESVRREDWASVGALSEILGSPAGWLGSAPPAALEPLATTAGFYGDWLAHPERDDYWAQRTLTDRLGEIDVPVLLVGGWYDVFLDGTLQTFHELAGRGGDRRTELIVGPWAHLPWGSMTGDVDFGESSGSLAVVDPAQARFFSHCLEAHPPAEHSGSEVRYFLMFDADGWRTASSWPPPEAIAATWFLRSGGLANTSSGDGELSRHAPEGAEPADVYTYYPAVPVPAAGGHSAPFPDQVPMGAKDQRHVQRLPEVLVYSSPTLSDDLELVGPVVVDLYVASTGESADFAAKLCVVREGGEVINIADGITRVRGGLLGTWERSEPVPVRIDLRATAAKAHAGERLRLEITGGAFPAFDRNPQSSVAPALATPLDLVSQSHLVFHSSDAPSALTFRVRERAGRPAHDGRTGA